jgi:hypothetical protein
VPKKKNFSTFIINLSQGVMLSAQVLQTLYTLLELSDPNNLTLYTNLFWGASAVLYSDQEDQFISACNVLDFIVSSLDFNDMVVR